jgi:hypothetical protein
VAPEPEGSSPPSQQPANGPYSEPGESTPDPPQPISLRSILIPTSYLLFGLPSGRFPSGFPPKTLNSAFVGDSAPERVINFDVVRIQRRSHKWTTSLYNIFDGDCEHGQLKTDTCSTPFFKIVRIKHIPRSDSEISDLEEIKREERLYTAQMPAVNVSENTTRPPGATRLLHFEGDTIELLA